MMGSGFGASLARGWWQIVAVIFMAGMLTTAGLWAAWHYVLSHITIGWR